MGLKGRIEIKALFKSEGESADGKSEPSGEK
jgi:hypothetical protein